MDELSQPPGTPRLYIDGYGPGPEYIALDREYVVGRDPAADFVLDEEDFRSTSRRALVFTFTGSHWQAEHTGRNHPITYVEISDKGESRNSLHVGATMILNEPSTTFYFPGTVDRLELEALIERDTDGDSTTLSRQPLHPGDGIPTMTFDDVLTDYQRAVAATLLEPCLKDPTLSIQSARTNKEAGQRLGKTEKAIEHVMQQLRDEYYGFIGKVPEGDQKTHRFALLQFLLDAHLITKDDLTRLP